MTDAYIVDGTRTPWGKYGGALRDLPAAELAAICMRELVSRHSLAPDSVENVVLGQVLQGGAGMHPGRQALVRAGLSAYTPASLVNKVCGSSVRAITLAASGIRLGEHDLVFAGGMESMSSAPYYDFHTRWGARKGDVTLVDAVDRDGLWCAFGDCHMATYTDQYARETELGRDVMDQWALESQRRWGHAYEAGFFEREVTPVPSTRNPGHIVLDRDENPRPESTTAGLARLITVFETDGITAGNSPAVNDGAAVLLLASQRGVERLGVAPLARVVSHVEIAVEPHEFPIASAVSIRKLVEKAGVPLEEVEVIEINEAFAAIPLIAARELGHDLSRANRHGGAVAVGHPVGATGARMVLTAALQLAELDARYAIASICSGTGQGDAVLLERV